MDERRAQVLRALANGPVSGPDIADDLDISRAAVWKHVEQLRDAGFEIESSGSGYELTSIPEFSGPAIEFELDAPYSIEFHDSIGSTNVRARELADEGQDNTVVIADTQTGGRGRLDREWVSPSGGMWFSILLRPDRPPHHAPVYTLAAAVATARIVRDRGGDATIKWPNDLLLDGKKLAGILTEMEGEADRISWLVVGIGLNANVDTESLPGDQPATTLRDTIGDIDRREAIQDLLVEFHDLTQNLDAIIPAWRELSATLGTRVRVETPGETVVGEAVDIEYPGTLIVETDDGRQEVTAGDCEHLRPVE